MVRYHVFVSALTMRVPAPSHPLEWADRHRVALGAATALLTSVVVAHALPFDRPTDDWARYDHRTFTVAAVIDGDTLQLDDGTRVSLLGLADPVPAALPWLTDRAVGRPITLMLPPVGCRDADGRLVAYAYDADVACLNVDLVAAGLAYADRRSVDPLAGPIDTAEREARRKGRGLWHELQFEQMPPWRQAWARAQHH